MRNKVSVRGEIELLRLQLALLAPRHRLMLAILSGMLLKGAGEMAVSGLMSRPPRSGCDSLKPA